MILKSLLAIALVACFTIALPLHAATPPAKSVEAARLDQIFEDYFEESLERNPIQATSIGDPRYNDLLPNFLGAEAIAAQRRFNQRWLAQIGTIDREALAGQDRLSYDIFVYDLRISLEGDRFPEHLIPMNQFVNLPSFFARLGSGQSIQPFASEKDYRDFLSRIDGMIVIMDQMILNMREGIEQGIVQPRVLMEKVVPQIEAQIVDRVEDSVFYQPIAAMPDSIGAEARTEITRLYAEALRESLLPAYKRLLAFVKEEYLPRCRESIAISDLPDGKAWYAYLVKTSTTSDLTPDQIHQFGLEEVERITAEMRAVMKQVGFQGDLPAFFEHLETDDRFYYTDKEELLQGYRDLRESIGSVLPKAFDIFPKTEYEVREVPSFMAESSAGAFYQPGTPDGSRPGVFYVNTFNLRAQPKFGMETLSIHEAAPGHHFQISIAQEIEELPRFRRFGGTSAYFEGWALYTESLGKELGLFKDPYQYYGRLSDEMLRAMRLVVDTGMHAKGWSRERAIRYMLDHSSMAESDVVAEVERYIAIPGQALSYKVGQRVISDLRKRAEKELGDRFDLKSFHRAVLIDGALPLGVLEEKMGEWIATQAGRRG